MFLFFHLNYTYFVISCKFGFYYFISECNLSAVIYVCMLVNLYVYRDLIRVIVSNKFYYF